MRLFLSSVGSKLPALPATEVLFQPMSTTNGICAMDQVDMMTSQNSDRHTFSVLINPQKQTPISPKQVLARINRLTVGVHSPSTLTWIPDSRTLSISLPSLSVGCPCSLPPTRACRRPATHRGSSHDADTIPALAAARLSASRRIRSTKPAGRNVCLSSTDRRRSSIARSRSSAVIRKGAPDGVILPTLRGAVRCCSPLAAEAAGRAQRDRPSDRARRALHLPPALFRVRTKRGASTSLSSVHSTERSCDLNRSFASAITAPKALPWRPWAARKVNGQR
jgi:hypothetical protein